MTARRWTLVAALVLALACGGAASGATGTTSSPSSASGAATTSTRPSRAHTTAGSRTHAKPRRAPTPRTRTAGSTPTTAASGAPRRLDEIAIEGEVPVPQVLFITARDQRRLLDADPSRYVRTSRQLAEATPAPTRVIVVGDTAHVATEGGAK